MKKTCLLVAIVLLAPAAFAGLQAPIELIEQDLVPAQNIVRLSLTQQPTYTTGPVPVNPTPIDPDPGFRDGPVAIGDRDTGIGFGSAIVTPRGGAALYSPRQQAGREIDRLIRKLD